MCVGILMGSFQPWEHILTHTHKKNVCEGVGEKEGDLVGLHVHSIPNIESRPRG